MTPRTAWHRALRTVQQALLALCFTLPAAQARAESFLDPDLFEAYKRAATREGCDAIPYEAERKVCKAASQKKAAACRDFSCDRSDADRLIARIEGQEKNLERFVKERRSAKAIEPLLSSLEENRLELSRLVESSSGTAKRAVACREARVAVQSAFARATRRVDDEKSYNNELFENWREHLVRHFEDGVPGHRTAIAEANKAADTCKAVAKIDPRYFQTKR